MYLDVSSRVQQTWRFTYPDPSWFEASGRDADLDTVRAGPEVDAVGPTEGYLKREYNLYGNGSYLDVLNRSAFAEYRITYGRAGRRGQRNW